MNVTLLPEMLVKNRKLCQSIKMTFFQIQNEKLSFEYISKKVESKRNVTN